jgi:hypothetical protein
MICTFLFAAVRGLFHDMGDRLTSEFQLGDQMGQLDGIAFGRTGTFVTFAASASLGKGG